MYRIRFNDGMILSKVFRSKTEAVEVASYFEHDKPQVITQEQALEYKRTRVTIARVNAALASKGYTDTLQRGHGYFYFWGDDAANWFSSSVGVYRLSSLSIEQWVANYESLRRQYHQTQSAIESADFIKNNS